LRFCLLTSAELLRRGEERVERDRADAAYLRSEYRKYGELVKAAGIKVD
jgi:hypothetical protein